MSAVVFPLADTSAVPVTASVALHPGAIRVLLADVHAVASLPLRALLADAVDVRVVAEATLLSAGALASRLGADVIITGLSSCGSRELASIRRLVNAATSARILVMSAHPTDEWLLGVLDAGAGGVVSAHASRSEILIAVRAIANDQVIVRRSAIAMLARRLRANERKARGASPDSMRRLALLTGRERSVFRLVAEGFSAPEVGQQLSISTKSVETYKKRIGDKLGFSHRSEYVRFALEVSVLLGPGRDGLPVS
ncbi:MAG: response regulator transcription factor [Gemmatimonadaceae bacterium]